ncbi:hypothetical protein KP509_37G021000 [Ceratopteris richardii]|uniref:Bidirectional sugar transporter SWEET n=1 Tax=Ceratopteris richardii TaxID=49495 RepID=A0A8T2Q610_CERRI|nr:hypothetical protein KP509_37G021000 [Ceratopteris richardii]
MGMSMETLGVALGIAGNVIQIMVFASPIPTFWRIVKMRSTESFSAIPYLTTLLSNSLWLYYGLLKVNEMVLVTISGVGVLFGASYICLYLLFASKTQRVSLSKYLVLVGTFFGVVAFSTMRFSHGTTRILVVGLLCAVNSACNYASPLTVVKLVIKTKSVEYLPFWLCFFLATSAWVWLAYALVIRDPFLTASNSIGSLFGIIQLSLYAYYSRNKDEIMYFDTDGIKKKTTSSNIPQLNEVKVVEHEMDMVHPQTFKQ